jgi:uncharacterized protein YdeI (YjbR/CyaY-like superfamily)
MGVEDRPWIEITSRAQWRAWLEANHASEIGVWVVRFKKHCGDRHVGWPDVVQECLRFGWIDSQTKRVDDERVRLLATPRKPGSIWSAVNKEHIAELEAAGLMTPAGQARIDAAKADGSWTFLDDIDALVVPEDLAAALAKAKATARWEAVSPSERKRHLYAIKVAKRPPTRSKRIAAAVAAARER